MSTSRESVGIAPGTQDTGLPSLVSYQGRFQRSNGLQPFPIDVKHPATGESVAPLAQRGHVVGIKASWFDALDITPAAVRLVVVCEGHRVVVIAQNAERAIPQAEADLYALIVEGCPF